MAELLDKLKQLNDSQTREAQWGKAASASSYAAYVSGLLPAIIAALEDRDRLRAEVRALRGLVEYVRPTTFPLISALLDDSDG